jgi:hypothetical protein
MARVGFEKYSISGSSRYLPDINFLFSWIAYVVIICLKLNCKMNTNLNRSSWISGDNIESSAQEIDVASKSGGHSCRSTSEIHRKKISDQRRRFWNDGSLRKVVAANSADAARGKGSLEAAVTFDERCWWFVVNLK